MKKLDLTNIATGLVEQSMQEMTRPDGNINVANLVAVHSAALATVLATYSNAKSDAIVLEALKKQIARVRDLIGERAP